jgi:hypothetical protein
MIIDKTGKNLHPIVDEQIARNKVVMAAAGIEFEDGRIAK